MKTLFAYGTLMCEEIMCRVAGCSLGHSPAVLWDFSRYSVKGEPYPAILASKGGKVEGVAYHDITETAWSRLDRFEGEMYERCLVTVMLPDGGTEPAFTYVIKPEYEGRLDSTGWDLDTFLRSGRKSFETQYPGYDALK